MMTKEQKEVMKTSGADWNNQCKNFMMSRQPFTDKTARACFDRHFAAKYPSIVITKGRK
ncbi:MAG: hypothetical protein WCO84_08600 [bacterium]